MCPNCATRPRGSGPAPGTENDGILHGVALMGLTAYDPRDPLGSVLAETRALREEASRILAALRTDRKYDFAALTPKRQMLLSRSAELVIEAHASLALACEVAAHTREVRELARERAAGEPARGFA